MLSFVSGQTKDNIEVIHFYIKSRGVQGFVFVQITFKVYTNVYFENSEIGIKTTFANFVDLNSMKRLCMFLHCYGASF